MPKLNRYQRTELKNLVTSATIRRLSLTETQQLIKRVMDVDLCTDYISHYRMQLKHESANELRLLQQDRDYYLKCTFFDRLAEFEYQQRVLHRVRDTNEDNPDVQIKAVNALHTITQSLIQAYQSLPAVSTLSVPIPFTVDDNSNIVMQQQQRLEQQKRESESEKPALGPNGTIEDYDTYNRTF